MHFYFQAKTQHENLGDRGIARALLALAAKRGRVTVNTRGCPADYAAELQSDGHRIVDEHPLRFAVRAANHCRTAAGVVFLMKPGHFSGNDGGTLARLAQLTGLLCMRVAGVQVCRFGASVGPFTRTTAVLERLASRLYARYTVREPLSQAYCTSIGIPRAEYFPDLAFCLPHSFVGSGPSAERDIAFTVSFRDSGAGNEHIHAAIKVVLRHPQHSAAAYAVVTQVSRDRIFSGQLAARMSPRPCLEIHHDEACTAAVFDMYRRSRMVLSNRLHVLLFAAAVGAIPIALVDTHVNAKIVGVFKAAGLERLLVHTDHVQPVEEQLHRVISEAVELQDVLLEALTRQRLLLQTTFDEAFV